MLGRNKRCIKIGDSLREIVTLDRIIVLRGNTDSVRLENDEINYLDLHILNLFIILKINYI